MRKHRQAFILFFIVFLCFPKFSHATERYVIDPEQSTLKGLVRYTLVGKYSARFKEFEGTLNFDENDISKSHVEMTVETASLQSRFKTLDRIVRSSRLLDAAVYPQMIFRSSLFEQKDDQYYVTGKMTMHGVTQELTFPFSLEGPLEHGEQRIIKAKGRWPIKRKSFGIIWSKIFDKGGIIVGNTVYIDWEIIARKY